MRLVWYDGTLQEVKDNRFYQSFKDYLLIPYDADRKNNLDELEDEILDEQDELLEERGQTYTKETEEYLKTKSKQTLDKIKGASFKELVKDIPLGNLKAINLNEFPDDYKIKDVRNTPRTEQLITPFETKGALEKDYTVSNLEKRLRDSINSKEDLADFITFDDNSPEDKIILKFDMPSETPEERNGKIGWYESLGIEVALHKPEDTRAATESPKSSIVSISDELKGILALRPKEGDTTDFEKALIDGLFDNRNDFERIILSNMPNKLLDSNTLYDFTMELTIRLRQIPENKLYERDNRREIMVDEEKQLNPNYGEFLLDEDGEKIPKFEGDELDNLVEIKTRFRTTATATLKPRTTMSATGGQTERIRGLGRGGMTAGRAGEFRGEKINMARKYYLNLVKARLEKLEDAISNIPTATEA